MHWNIKLLIHRNLRKIVCWLFINNFSQNSLILFQCLSINIIDSSQYGKIDREIREIRNESFHGESNVKVRNQLQDSLAVCPFVEPHKFDYFFRTMAQQSYMEVLKEYEKTKSQIVTGLLITFRAQWED